MEYFIVDLQTHEIVAITDTPSGVSWSKPHVFVETQGLAPENAKILFDGQHYWAESTEQAPQSPWWKFW